MDRLVEDLLGNSGDNFHPPRGWQNQVIRRIRWAQPEPPPRQAWYVLPVLGVAMVATVVIGLFVNRGNLTESWMEQASSAEARLVALNDMRVEIERTVLESVEYQHALEAEFEDLLAAQIEGERLARASHLEAEDRAPNRKRERVLKSQIDQEIDQKASKAKTKGVKDAVADCQRTADPLCGL